MQNLHANSEYLLYGAGEPTRVIHLPAFDTNEEKDVAFVRSLGVPIKIKSPVYGESTALSPLPLISHTNLKSPCAEQLARAASITQICPRAVTSCTAKSARSTRSRKCHRFV